MTIETIAYIFNVQKLVYNTKHSWAKLPKTVDEFADCMCKKKNTQRIVFLQSATRQTLGKYQDVE